MFCSFSPCVEQVRREAAASLRLPCLHPTWLAPLALAQLSNWGAASQWLLGSSAALRCCHDALGPPACQASTLACGHPWLSAPAQVQKTCETLNAHGFRDIRTMEVLLRSHEVSRVQLATDLEAAPVAPAGKRQGRQQQQGRGAKRPRSEGGEGGPDAAAAAGEVGAGAGAAAEGAGSEAAAAPAVAAAPKEAEAAAPTGGQQQQEQQQHQTRQIVSKPVPFGRGHTGYLTFARRVVSL